MSLLRVILGVWIPVSYKWNVKVRVIPGEQMTWVKYFCQWVVLSLFGTESTSSDTMFVLNESHNIDTHSLHNMTGVRHW